MAVSITVPSPGESITEVTLGTWHRADGDWVDRDDLLVEIESDKATLEIRSPEAGKLNVKAQTGDDLDVGAVLAEIDPSAPRPAAAPSNGQSASAASTTESAPTTAAPAPDSSPSGAPRATSVARKVAAEHGVDLHAVQGTGTAGRITKDDVLAARERAASPAPATTPGAAPAASESPTAATTAPVPAPAPVGSRGQRRERMPRIRQRIAERLVEAKHTTAMLTTFNEADMTSVMALRSAHKEEFQKTHGVGLGFMGFFVAAAVSALRAHPRVNAYIVGDEIEFHDFCDVAVAVGTDRGLVVPVIRNAEALSIAGIESTIKDLAVRARDGALGVDEMTGGTFTISNGGVYGSLNSTPILNPPQSAILGMHAITKRPVEDPDQPGQIALRPMMYLALSYDHRIIDGAEAVGFLVHIRNCIEHPERLLLAI